MSQTSVKMLMVGFAHCEAGLFSTLQCGKEKLYIQEPPFNALVNHQSCIPGGIYNVVRVPLRGDEFVWCITNVPERNAIQFGHTITEDAVYSQLLVGTELGMFDNKWCVDNTIQGIINFNKWLDGVQEFRLYIDRVFPQIHTNLKQGDI